MDASNPSKQYYGNRADSFAAALRWQRESGSEHAEASKSRFTLDEHDNDADERLCDSSVSHQWEVWMGKWAG